MYRRLRLIEIPVNWVKISEDLQDGITVRLELLS